MEEFAAGEFGNGVGLKLCHCCDEKERVQTSGEIEGLIKKLSRCDTFLLMVRGSERYI